MCSIATFEIDSVVSTQENSAGGTLRLSTVKRSCGLIVMEPAQRYSAVVTGPGHQESGWLQSYNEDVDCLVSDNKFDSIQTKKKVARGHKTRVRNAPHTPLLWITSQLSASPRSSC
jgi:hypothetical protein